MGTGIFTYRFIIKMNQNVGKYTMDSMDPMGYDLKRNEIFEVIPGAWHMSPKEACLMSECQPSQIQIEK